MARLRRFELLTSGSGDQRETAILLSLQAPSLTRLHLRWQVLFSYCSHPISLLFSRLRFRICS